jgi:hypothetical protein
MGLVLKFSKPLKPEKHGKYTIKTYHRADTYGAFYDWEVLEKTLGKNIPEVVLSGRQQLNAYSRGMTKKKLIIEIKKELDRNRPQKLPTVKTCGKTYFVDKRLRQIRNVKNYNDFETVSMELINHWEDTGKLKR